MSDETQRKVLPVLIVGSGLAGLSAALALAERNVPATLLTSHGLGRATSSGWAQGGIAAAMADDDDPALHAADTLAAGAGLCDAGAVRLITGAAPDAVRWLEAQGVVFDRQADGALKLGLEGAHSRRRIVHAEGDGTGYAIVEALREKVQAATGITIVENVQVMRLALQGERIAGVWIRRNDFPEPYDLAESADAYQEPQRDLEFMPAAHVVLATGGVGGLWQQTTNPATSRGQGLALAARAGAVLRDVEFMQFHPTAMDVHAAGDAQPMPLASEALRGEGAFLINDRGERFMDPHPQKDLAPRDVVARAIFAQLQAGRRVFLDARGIEKFARKFPTINSACRMAGINAVAQPIPVRPAAHYHMGGVRTDLDGRTSVAGLWACGEVASTGLQGANRLASNSLLEAVVMGRRVGARIAVQDSRPLAERAKAWGVERSWTTVSASEPLIRGALPLLQPLPQGEGGISEVRRLMSAHVGVTRDEVGLGQAVGALEGLALHSDAALAGLMIATAAGRRDESRGAQARVDFPALADGAMHQEVRCEFVGDTVFVVSRMAAVETETG